MTRTGSTRGGRRIVRFAPGSTPPRLSDNLVTLVFSVSVGFVIADSTIRYYLKSATRERIGLYTFPSSLRGRKSICIYYFSSLPYFSPCIYPPFEPLWIVEIWTKLRVFFSTPFLVFIFYQLFSSVCLLILLFAPNKRTPNDFRTRFYPRSLHCYKYIYKIFYDAA